MQWHKSESTVKPSDIDEQSSESMVLLHRNITEEERTDQDGNTVIMYVYEEAMIAKDDYYDIMACVDNNINQTEQNTANIDYIAMETGIDLEV